MKFLMLNRSRALLGLGAALALGLAGCNGGDDGGPNVTPTATVAPTAAATPTAIANAFSGAYTGTYRAPSTGEVGTFLFTIASDGALSGSVASPFSPALISITGLVSSAGALQAGGTIGSGSQASRISITAQVRNVGTAGVVSGTFTSASSAGSVSGVASANEVPGQPSVFNGSYEGTFVNVNNTAQNGTVSATVDNAQISASIQVPGIGLVQGRGIVDLSTGQLTVSAPFSTSGIGGNIAQLLSLSGRLVRSGTGVVGTGAFTSTAGGRGTFRVAKTIANG